MLYGWTDLVLGSAGGTHPAYSAPWPMFRSNPLFVGEPGESPPPWEPEPPFDPCAEFGDPSYDRIACDVDRFFSETSCELTAAIQKKVGKATDALVAAGAADNEKRAKKLGKRARRRLAVARRKARTRSLSPECRDAVRKQLFLFMERLPIL